MSAEKVSENREYWEVQLDHGMTVEAPSTRFERCGDTDEEFQPGDNVQRMVDEGGYWEAVILYPVYSFDCVRFVIEITNWEHSAVRAYAGYQFAELPQKLKKI